MATNVRLKRLEKLALQHASQVVLYELSDPRLTPVTLTRCKLTADLSWLTIHWSVIGTEADRNKVSRALDQARPVVQGAIADAFQTRRTPRIKWKFDKGVEGALRVTSLLEDLKRARQERGDDEELPEELPDDDTI